MSPVVCFQFILFSFCVNLFTLFSYFIYYSDRLCVSENILEEYDYIIVGSGTAGSVIGHRLASETSHSFIILEAGSRGHALLDIPVLGPFLHRSVFDWQFETEPQDEACFAMEGRKCRLPQGKILGGSSKLNNMIHIRGNTSHYVDWFHGKYTKDFVERQLQYIEEKILFLNSVQYESRLSEAVIQAAKELGYNSIDTNFSEGFAKTKLSQKNGKRWSIADLLKKNVITNALVENIIFSGNNARGVKVNILSKKYNIFAKKGVILSAGALNTPKILQLSGIGPKNVLKTLNIPILKMLPVGQNLQDHVTTGLDLVLFNKSVSIDAFDMINPINVFQYFFNGKGALTTPGCEAVGFVDTKNQGIPDLQFMVLPVGLSSDRGTLFSKNLGVKEDIWTNYIAKTMDKYVATILPVVLHPKSKGEVYIRSKDIKDQPVFDPKYLSNKNDVEILVNGLNLIKELVESSAMKDIGAYLNGRHFPGCQDHIFFSDSYLECYVRHLTLTSYHPVGTCSMGLPGDKNTVVDLSFRVVGVEKLFVVDASVLPTLPSGNINAAVAMMGSIFFDANIRPKAVAHKTELYCKKNNIFHDKLYNMCFER